MIIEFQPAEVKRIESNSISQKTRAGVVYQFNPTESLKVAKPESKGDNPDLQRIADEISEKLRYQGAQTVFYIGDGSSDNLDEVAKYRIPKQVTSVGKYSRMEEVWRNSDTKDNFMPSDETWALSNKVDYILVDISNMNESTINDVNDMAKRLLAPGGVMFVCLNGTWNKFMKLSTGELDDITDKWKGVAKRTQEDLQKAA